MRRALLLPNPSASGFTGAGFRGVLAALRSEFEVSAAWAETPKEATGRAAEAAAAGYDVVVAMGGDGIVHHVANGLLGTETALGLVPAGTTNVLARILSIPRRSVAAATALCAYDPVPHPLAHVVAEDGRGVTSCHATFALGIGFDADVVSVAERRPASKLRLGSVHYAATAAGRVFGEYRGRLPTLRVECDGERVDAVAVMVQIHDRYTYFGAVPMFISSTPALGPTAVAIGNVSPRRAMTMFRDAVLRRSLENSPGCTVMHAFEKLVVEADPASPYQADGELLGIGRAFEVTSAPDAVRILVPPRR